ncbi:TetR/AcrR family transcriptional regulator [Arsenicibacter rosenii]|uniref:TetR/AcrR family transcriptional regulator n=1 Tax=Arsenicibacter rosenii TaxID=1750698 RepID=UPI0009F220DC|nr:helix-turn-helix domain-containing protein [Arsenicibacter rosenii]
MPRGRAHTEQRLIDAVGKIIAEEGFDQLGINRISAASGINKILIYRYFGGLDGLMKAYYKQNPPVVQLPRIDPEQFKGATIEEIMEASCEYMLLDFRLLRQNIQTLEYLRADLLAHSEKHTNPMADKLEQETHDIVETMSGMVSSEYGRSVSAIMISALRLLTFMSQDKRTLMGIDLGTDEGWAQIEQAVRRIFYGLALAANETHANNQNLLMTSATRQTSSKVL